MDFMPPFPGSSPLVTLRRARVTLSGHLALNSVDFTLHAGNHTVLRGGNGAGKSTLLRVLRGEQWLDQGADGQEAGEIVWYPQGRPETSPLSGRGMTALVSASQQERILSQGWAITGEDLIYGGLADAVYVLRPAQGDDRDHIHGLAAWLGAEALLERRVPELSQGELRLLLVARAMVRNPAVLLLDEVTDGLDTDARDRLLGVLEKASKIMTLVASTHRPETLPPWMRTECRLASGRVVACGPMNAMPPESEASLSTPTGAADLTSLLPPVSSPSPACSPDASDQPPVSSGSVALALTAAPLLLPVPAGPRIEIRNATVYINSNPVLRNLSWVIAPGENWAVIGANGAGKSTLLRLIAGDETPAYGGSITRFLPRQGGAAHSLDVIRRGIRLVSDLQQATYGYNLCGEDLVLSGSDNTVGLYRIASTLERQEAARCMTLLGVTHLARRSIRNCSTGEKRRLLLARALMGSPDLLLLDEPCSGLDPAAREQLLGILNRLGTQGIQFVLVTHHPDDIIPAVSKTLVLSA